MIIVGNSNVDCFVKSRLKLSSTHRVVQVKWVGALQITHFHNNHPSAVKVLELFHAEPDWKFLSIGTHDIFSLCHWASLGKFDEALAQLLNLYVPIFKKFHELGQFAWMVFPQPSEQTSFPNLSGQDILAIAQRFNGSLQQWCLEEGIPVINPLAKILGQDGLPLPELLQQDKIHLNTEGAKLYLEDMAALIGEPIDSVAEPIPFVPRTELESFCSLVLNNLGVPWKGIPSRDGLQQELLALIRGMLKKRDIEIEISRDSDLVSSGLLDSLNLVEIYTHAAHALRMDIPFDVDLLVLNTVAKVCNFLYEKFDALHHKQPSWNIGQVDFMWSLQGNFDDSAQRQQILSAEIHIAKMDPALFKGMHENILVAGDGIQCLYGMPLFWLALYEAEHGDYAGALVLLGHATNPSKNFALRDGRVAYYRAQWLQKLKSTHHLEGEWDGEADRAQTQDAQYIWDERVDNSVLAIEQIAQRANDAKEQALYYLEQVETFLAGDDLQGALAILEHAIKLTPDEPQLVAIRDGLAAQLGSLKQQADHVVIADKAPLVTAIVSTYNGERFIRGCLADLEAQTIADRLEIIVVDSGSPQNEGSIVEEFQKRYSNIKYIRTDQRETIYQAWNRGVSAATGKYITNANVDDRHHPDAFERLSNVLRLNPDIAVVYADVAVTSDENQSYDNARIIGHFRWPDYDPRLLFQVCYVGPQPMWRKVLHDKYGLFDSAFKSAGDYEFWLRLAVNHEKFLHIPDVMGVYLLAVGGAEHSNPQVSYEETATAQARYWPGEWGQRPVPGGSFFVQSTPTASPLVSVILATRNRPKLLLDALKSIVSQDYNNWEVIVVNDGGDDIESLVMGADPQGRIRYICSRTNFGQVTSRNMALRLSKGEIICYLDDDDIFLSNHLSTVVSELEKHVADFVYTDAEYVQERLAGDERIELKRVRPYENIEYSKERLHVENFIPINTWAHRWNCLQKVGLFDESLTSLEDWELLLRFSRQFILRHIHKVTVEVRQRADSADNVSSRRRPDFPRMFRRIYAKHDDLGNDRVCRLREQTLQSLDAEFPAEAQAIRQEKVDVQANQKELDFEEVQRFSYQSWISKHSLQEIDGQLLAERMVLKWTSRPVIHFVMYLYAGEEDLLADTLDSLVTQMYPEWRLSVIAAFAPPGPVFSQFERLQWIEVNRTQDVPETINQMVNVIATDWLGFIPAGIRFTPQYLVTCADYINIRPQWRLIYTDEDVIDKEGKRSDPKFKPDMNLDMLRSMPYFGNYLLRRDTFVEMGGYSRIAGLESYDLALRALDTAGESAMGHIADVLFHMPVHSAVELEKSGLERVLTEHLRRNGIAGEVVEGYQSGTCRVIYQHAGQPLVSIVVPTRNKLEFIQPCIDSLFEKTDYPNFEVLLVDNQSDDPDVLEFYEEAKLRYGDRLRVMEYPREFNFSAINNFAAEQALGEYLLLLNNDTQIVQAEWLSRMMAYGQRPEVGVVGARLVYPETGKLQHAGVVLGMTGVADHPFNGILSLAESGYMKRAQVDQNYSAVTAACMLVRKSVYQSVGGMDEEKLKVLFNDVDICLKVGQSGYKIVWTPYATVVHYGSSSLKDVVQDLMKVALSNDRARTERETMYERWMRKLSNDPAYNKNLSLSRTDFAVENVVVIDWDTNFHDRPRILGVPLSGASGEYRIKGPFHALSHAGLAQTNVVMTAKMFKTRVVQPAELARAEPDSLVLQAAIDDKQLEALSLYKRLNSGVLRIFTLDDLLTQPPKKSSFYKYSYKDAKPRLRKALSLSDRLIVTTQPLADLCKGMIDDIRIIPNCLERAIWGGASSLRMQGKKPRVGWAGAQQHAGDLGLIHEVVKATAHEVDWIFFGMCPDELHPHIREFHDFVLSFDEYPAKLAGLNLDLAVAPLEINAFNEAKSNLRLLEYGIMGWPVVCTDILPYHGAPVKRVPNQAEAWIDAIRERVNDLDAAHKEGDQLREWVLSQYVLEDHLDEWMAALVRS